MNVEVIIRRCTRDGVTSWQHVAAQLGRSVDSVRAQHDPSYLRAYVWAPSREADPELAPVDEEDTSSPHVKGPGLKVAILALLARQSMSAEALSNMLHSPVNSIRARLDRLQADGKVCHDGAYPRTWAIREADGTPRVYGATALDVSDAIGLRSPDLGKRASMVGLRQTVVFAGQRPADRRDRT